MRSPLDYQKVRVLLGHVFRNRRFQGRSDRVASRAYLNLGCGPCATEGFVNLDYRWAPGVDVVWDLIRPLPFPDGRFQGIFSEHCLEHFDEVDLLAILAELFRVLRPGGLVRIVVPSLEIHIENYLANRQCRNDGASARELNAAFYCGHRAMRTSRWLNDGHQFVHDFTTLAEDLRAVGFVEPRKCAVLVGADPKLLVDRPDRAIESLYIEARKPHAAAEA